MQAIPRRVLGLLTLLALLVLIPACGDDEAPAADVKGTAQAVDWQDAEPLRAELSEEVVHVIELPDDPKEWRLDTPPAFRRKLPFEGETERLPALVLERAEGGQENRWDLGIDGQFDPRSFNVMRIKLATEAGCRVSARFYRDQKVAFASRGQAWVDSTTAGAYVDIEMPELRFQARPLDQLQITIRSMGTLAIRSIELVQRPLAHWLPRPDEGSDLVHLGPISRDAIGLWSGTPLVAEVSLDQPAALSFSCGVPGTLEYPDRESMKIHLHATGAEGTVVEETITLPARGKASNRWNHVEIPLDSLKGATAQLRLELEVPGDSEGIYAIAESKLVQRALRPPTVILVTSDTHRYDHVGAANSGIEVSTPTLDGLAERGVFFENCFTSTNVTNPSHVAIMTATHPRDTGILDNTSPLVREAQTLAENYRAAGWRTWAVLSAIHLGDRESGLGQGFDRMSIPNGPDYVAQQAVDTLLEWAPDADGAPLFIWLHLFDAHIPYAPPGQFDRKYYEGDDPFDPNLPEDSIPVEEIHPSLTGLRDPEYPLAQYRAEVDYLDAQLGRLLGLDRARNGVVAVTSDHGENLGHHGIYYDHGNLYPDTIHVPLVVAWPGAPGGLRVEHPIDQLDLGKTLLELSQIEVDNFPGTSMLPVLEQAEVEPTPRFALGSHALSCAANYGRWHLILHLREHAPLNFTTPRELHQVELFDLSVDPLCEKDVVDEFPEDARRMRAMLIDWLESASETGWASEGRKDPDTMARLRDLGYTTADGGDIQLYDQDCECEWCERFR